MRQEAAGLPEAPQPAPRRAPAMIGAASAAVLAVGLGWWLTTSGQASFSNPESAKVHATAAMAAPRGVDAEQVRRGVDEFAAQRAVGAAGLDRFRESCAASARSDGRIVDFCLAFDLMADPSAAADAGRVSLVAAAIPEELAPAARVAAVRAELQASGAIAIAPPPIQVAESPAPAVVPKIVAKPVRAPAAKSVDRCALLSIPADRVMCANPSLKSQHARMRAAYDQALENGANPLSIDRGQAEWRALRNAADTRQELAALYAKRIRELKAAAEEARLTPPN